jgi:hypothetical protein
MAVVAAALACTIGIAAQTLGEKEEFTAVAIANDEFASGAGTVLIRIDRWSTEAERTLLVDTLQQKGSRALLDELQGMRSVGTIRTPDSLAYDLRYAHQARGADGGRQIVIATDRPIGFWEAANSARTLDYPFVVIQMQIGPDGKGKGTLSYATRIRAYGKVIELENFSIAPIMLTNIESRKNVD